MDSKKHNGHVVAYKKAIARQELGKVRETLAKWQLQTKLGIKF